MATIKIRSNPYERKIEYLSYKEQVGEWEEIQRSNPDSKLREDESGKSFWLFIRMCGIENWLKTA